MNSLLSQKEEEAHALGRGLQRNGSLRVLKADKMVLEPQALLRAGPPSPATRPASAAARRTCSKHEEKKKKKKKI